MPPKKSAAAAKPASKIQGPTYEDMIKDAISNLKERKGSSRPSLKKYVKANNKTADGPTFDKLFNNALSRGVKKGIFEQPKGASGTVKLALKNKSTPAAEKKPAAEKPAAKPAAKKTTATKKVGAPKKTTAATAKKAAAAPKKAGAPKKAAAAAPKKAAAKKTGPKKAAPAPAIENKPVILGKTKTGRITKTTQKSAPPAAKTATKKKVTKVPAKSKATPKKATPKKA